MSMFDNLNAIFKAKRAKQKFFRNHPKMEPFVDCIHERGFCPGQEIAIAIRYPDGTEYKQGIRVTESDLELLNIMKDLGGSLT